MRILEDNGVNVIHNFMYTELLLYLAIGSCSNSTIARWSANEKSIIDLHKSNNAPYKNIEQEWTKLLIKNYNLHKANDFTYNFTIFIGNTKLLEIG